MIKVSGLSIGFNDSLLIDNLSFEVIEGEIFTLTGESGRGKSSLFNAILGFLKPKAGKIEINNLILNSANLLSIRNSIGWLPQNLNSLPNLPIKKQFDLFASFRKNHQIFNFRQFEELADIFRLKKDILEANYNELSGGEKQRIGLAYTLIQNKPILLLDEPTSALDDISEKAVTNYIASRNDLTVLATSHSDYWTSKSTQTLRI